jgi:hypothetical protein
MTFIPLQRVVMTVQPKGEATRAVWAAPNADTPERVRRDCVGKPSRTTPHGPARSAC